MLPFGHTAVGYLIAKKSRQKLTLKEIVLVVVAANIFDLDFFLLTILGITGGQHHYYSWAYSLNRFDLLADYIFGFPT